MIDTQRHLFDIPDEIAYLNCAYLSPLMHSVQEAGRSGLARKARPWEIHPKDFWEEPNRARALFAGLIGADADGVAVVPSASYGMATAALNLPLERGQTIVLLEDQFPSNVTHWADLAAKNGATLNVVARPPDSDWTPRVLEAIDKRTGIVALPNCHWTDGTLIDLLAIGARCRAVGAALALDITQSIGAMAFDVTAVQPDFLVAAGYKWLMAPYSVGFLWVAPKHRAGKSLELGYIARASHPRFRHITGQEMPFAVSGHRFDVGESGNFALMPAACAAMEQLTQWGPAAIQATLAGYTAPIAAWARERGLLVADDRLRAGHFVGIRFPGGLPEQAVERLAARNVFVSKRGDSLRITPHLYNNEADRERLLEGIATLRDTPAREVA
jgi:selenocysteine lyase/cysteine desulfurase